MNDEAKDHALEVLKKTLRAIGDKFDENRDAFELFRRGETVLLHTRDGLTFLGTDEAAAQLAGRRLVEEAEEFLQGDGLRDTS